jgi:hypothetical protein
MVFLQRGAFKGELEGMLMPLCFASCSRATLITIRRPAYRLQVCGASCLCIQVFLLSVLVDVIRT